MANPERLMRLVNQLSGTIRGVGAQRQQASMFRAQQQAQGQRMEFMKEQERTRVEENIADRELRLKELNLRMKESKARRAAIELDVETQRQQTLFDVAGQPETGAAFTERGAESQMQGVGGEMGMLRSINNFLRNIPGTAQIAAGGPRPGMTEPAFQAQQMEAGVDPAALSQLQGAEPVNYQQMKAAFDMNIMYGVDLPANFQAMPDVVTALEKGKVAYAQAQTDADRMTVIDIATAEANLKYAEWRAAHPGGVGGGAPQIFQPPPTTEEEAPFDWDAYTTGLVDTYALQDDVLSAASVAQLKEKKQGLLQERTQAINAPAPDKVIKFLDYYLGIIERSLEEESTVTGGRKLGTAELKGTI